LELEPKGRPEVPQAQKLMRRWISVAGCVHGGHRAKACGVEGEGAAMVEPDDGERNLSRPPFVEAYRKITRKLGCMIVDRMDWT